MSVTGALFAPLTSIARLWRRLRRAQEWKQKRREFVYLDEISVTSLLAARHGSIPESYKDTLSVTNSSDAASQLSLPATPAGPGAGITTRSANSRTESREVVRRAVVQGTFRTLRIGDADLKLSVEDQPERNGPSAAETAKQLLQHLPRLVKQHRATLAADLGRGDVIEVRVELRPDWSYQFTAAVSSMIDLIEGRAGMFGLKESAVAEVQRLQEVLARLLVDLVPIQARVISHRLVDIEGHLWLVDASMIATNSALERSSSDVHLAGVTELPSYWKDVRRVLFSGSAYSVYARIARPGLQTSWSPVKLADVFDRILPEVGQQIRELPYLFDAEPDSVSSAPLRSIAETLREDGLIPFGRDLARLAARSVSPEALAETAARAAELITTPEDLADVATLRKAFEEVVAAVGASPTIDGCEQAPIDREVVRTLREMHQSIVRMAVAIDPITVETPTGVPPKRPSQLLEAEVVAIYW